jgi:hypothetical protein
MDTVPNVIIAGNEMFCNRLYNFIDKIIPDVDEICYASKAELLYDKLKGKQYQLLFVQESFIKAPLPGKELNKIKTASPALKIIFFASGKKTANIKEADFVLPAEFSEKELAGILLAKEPSVPGNEADRQLILDALKDGFTIHQLQIFNGIVTNKTSSEIGHAICLSPRTVEDYRPGLFKAAGVKCVFHLALNALKRGWIDKDGKTLLDDATLKEFLKIK